MSIRVSGERAQARQQGARSRAATVSPVMGRSDNLANFIVVALSGILIGALTMRPAGQVRVLSETKTVHLGELFGFRATILTVCLVLIVVAAIELFVRKRRAVVAAIGFGVVLLVTAAWIITVEGVSLLIPRAILPATVRRFTIGLGVDIGPWLVTALCVVAILACLGLLNRVVDRFLRHDGEAVALYAGRVAAFVLAVGGAVLIGFGRSRPLAAVDWSGNHVDVETWALPYIGPGSLLVVMVIGVTAVVAMTGIVTSLLSVVGASAAWLSATVAGLLVATSGLMVETDIIEWAARRVGQDGFADSVNIGGGNGSMLMFLGAVAAGLGFAGLLLFGINGAPPRAVVDDEDEQTAEIETVSASGGEMEGW